MTSDPLGTGELLRNAYKAAQLIPNNYFDHNQINNLLKNLIGKFRKFHIRELAGAPFKNSGYQ
jgi:hypothetical protein